MTASFIPYARQDIDEADIDAVVAALRSDRITQGARIGRFEEAVQAYCGAAHAVAVSSGTAALHLACLAAGLGPGDRLWTSANTFVASANCGRYCGAEVDFVDIDPDTCNISVRALAVKLATAQRQGRLPRVVVPVHFAGHSAEMRGIRGLADEYGFTVIEDASHALGGRYQDTRVGACAYADMTVMSFHAVKLITTAEGGMVTTGDPELAATLRELRTHGITRDEKRMQRPSEGPWYYEQHTLGYNYRLTDVQAALGLTQLARLDEFLARRRTRAGAYRDLLAGLPLQLPTEREGVRSAWHLYVVRLLEHAQATRADVFDALRTAQIGVNVHYIPVHLQPYYRARGFGKGDFPEAEAYYAQALTLPLYPGLTDADQGRVADALAHALG